MTKAQKTKKCAAPGTDHFSSLRWAKTSTTWLLIAAPSRLVTFSTRSGAGWPLVMSRNRKNTRRPATGSATASMTSPTISTHEIHCFSPLLDPLERDLRQPTGSAPGPAPTETNPTFQ